MKKHSREVLAIVVMLVLAATTGLGQTLGFKQSELISSAIQPQHAASGDFNGDGNIDLAITHAGGHVVQIFLGNFDGTFLKLYSQFSLPQPSSWIAAADMDNDGDSDLVLTLKEGEEKLLRVYRNDGQGQFSVQGNFLSGIYWAGNSPVDGALADLNNDGWIDIVVAGDHGLILLLNDHAGYFHGEYEKIGVGRHIAVVVEDLDADGMLDIISSVRDQRSIYIWYGDAVRGFSSWHRIETRSSGSWHIPAVADFDNNGLKDIVVSNGVSESVSFVMQTDKREFQKAKLQSVVLEVIDLAVEDFNRDGWVDLFAVSQKDEGVLLWENGPDGFSGTEPQIIGTQFAPGSLHPVDLNSDGYLDMVVTYPEAAGFSYWLKDRDFGRVFGRVFTDLDENCVADNQAICAN